MKRKLRSFQKSGFTLVELLVVIAIMAIITSIAVFSDSQFNSSVILSNLAYEVALSVREAQSYGIDVHNANASSCTNSSCFDYVYGVDFNISFPKQYILFSNTGLTNFAYQNLSSTILNTFTVGQGYTIYKIAALSNPPSVWTSVSPVDISFVRPNPEAIIIENGGANPIENEVEICIQDPSGSSKRAIDIEPTGQISVVSGCN